MQLEVSWTDLKTFITDRNLPCQYVEFGHTYVISGIDKNFILYCRLPKESPASADQTDFETNFKSTGNTILEQVDTEGYPINKRKITKTGWHLQDHFLEFETSKLNSVYNKDKTETDLGFTTIKFYNSSDVELTTQASLDTDCVKTVVTWEPPYDFEILGATFEQEVAPSGDVRVWVTAVPDLTPAQGGSVSFVQGGFNLKRLGAGAQLKIDGKVPKLMSYDATYHTNKFEILVRHDAGIKHPIALIVDLYKG